MGSENQPPSKQENGFHSILFNILIPVVLLTQGDRFISNPAIVLMLALAFPIVYFLRDYQRRRKANLISILGFVSILLTGGVGLLKLPRFWFIVKETAIPALIGLAIVASLFTRYPLIRALVYSKEIFDVEKIQAALTARNRIQEMDRLLKSSTLLLAASFFLSSLLNFILASYFIQTEPRVDPVQFNAEVGAMTGWSYLVIALPSMLFLFLILYLVVNGIKKYAGLSFEDSLAPHLREESKSSKAT